MHTSTQPARQGQASRPAGDPCTAFPAHATATSTPARTDAPRAPRSPAALATLLHDKWMSVDLAHSRRAVEAIGTDAAERLLVVLGAEAVH